MPIINFKFTRINASREDLLPSAKVNVDESISMKDVSDLKMSINETQKAAKFVIEFEAKYKQNNDVKAKIEIRSEIAYLDDAKKIDKALKDWKDKNAIDPEIISSVHNLALTKSLIHALVLSDSLALPAPVNLPKIKIK